MYIAPNSTVKLLSNVPLEPQQDNTIFFTSKTQQRNWFNNYVKTGMTFENQYYQRHSKGFLKLEVLADNIFDCNYMMFQNTSFGNKWFYAFITNVEYVNNTVSMIQYEIDDMQSWFFDYQLGECFVEREHSETDEIGDNLIPENLATGDYWTEKLGNPEGLEDLSIVLFCTVDRNYDDIHGVWRQGTFSGLYPVTFDLTETGAQNAVNWINGIPPLKVGCIITACIMPTAFAAVNIAAEAAEYTKKTTLNRINGLGGYEQVKNNKLLTYPYNFLYVTNNEGKSAVYPYEYFDSETCQFEIFGDFTPNPQVIMYPLLYKGSSQNEDEALQLGGYPQVAFDVDAFKAWIAQSASSIGLASIGALIGQGGAGAQGLTGQIVAPTEGADTLYTGSMLALTTLVVKGAVAAYMPPQAHGTQSSSVKIPAGMMNYTFYRKYIRPEFATIIDDYFNMYGYACHRVKIPNIGFRPRWNYVKTIGCVFQWSRMPSDAARNIIKIYDKGITFWKSTATVGDYSADNSPVSP